MTAPNETPPRVDYTHQVCGTTNTLSRDAALEMAANPDSRPSLYCVGCGDAHPAKEFVWDADNAPVSVPIA